MSELAAGHPNIVPLVFDVTDASAREAVRQQIRAVAPALHRVVLNAGNCEYLDITQPDWSMMRRVMDVNFLGAVNTLAIAMELLQCRPDSRGHIIGVSSQTTFAAFPRAEAYGASKAALTYWLNSLRVDLEKHNIDVTVVNPGFVKTPLTDKNDFAMPFIISAKQAAERILPALLQRRRQLDFPGRLKWLLRVLTAVPGVWYRWVAPQLTRSASSSADLPTAHNNDKTGSRQ